MNITRFSIGRSDKAARDAKIIERLREGAKNSAVAAEFDLTPQRIRQIAQRSGLAKKA